MHCYYTPKGCEDVYYIAKGHYIKHLSCVAHITHPRATLYVFQYIFLCPFQFINPYQLLPSKHDFISLSGNTLNYFSFSCFVVVKNQNKMQRNNIIFFKINNLAELYWTITNAQSITLNTPDRQRFTTCKNWADSASCVIPTSYQATTPKEMLAYWV